MKKVIRILIFAVIFLSLFSISVGAQTVEEFNNSIEELKDSMSDELRSEMDALGATEPDISILSEISFDSILSMLTKTVSESAAAPMSAGAVILAVLLLSSLLEGYTDSLRHTSMKEVMGGVTALSVALTVFVPVISLITRVTGVIEGACGLMVLYIPVMIGMLAFSGNISGAVGQYGVTMTVCQLLSTLSSSIVLPMLSAYMGLSFSSGLSSRLKLSGFCSICERAIKWIITFMMTVFASVLTLRSVITGAMDSVATRAVRFTLSSFIPLVGAAISEAYRSLSAGLQVMRSGAGVFVIIALLVAFLPLAVSCVMWMLSISVCRAVAELLGVESVSNVLSCINTALSMLIAVIASVVTVYIISTASLMMLRSSV